MLDKENYRPFNIHPNPSKVYERITYKQFDKFMALKFSSYLCGLKKKHISQYYFLKMIETRKQQFDKKKLFWCFINGSVKSIRHNQPEFSLD